MLKYMRVIRNSPNVRMSLCQWRWRSLSCETSPNTNAEAEAEDELPEGRMWSWQVHSYGPLSELRLERARVPPLLAPEQLLVRVDAVSINPIDVAMIGGYGSRLLGAWRGCAGTDVEFPLVVGRDFSGRVERAGAGVGRELRPGTAVWGSLPPHAAGALSRYTRARAAWVTPAPSLPVVERASLPYAALTAAAALRAAGVEPAVRGAARGRAVLLLGLGGVGAAALQLLRHAGAAVCVGCPEAQAELARALGAAVVLERESPDYEKLLVDRGPYDAIVDCAGLGGAYAQTLRWQYERYVTLTSPLLRETDSRGLMAGAVAVAAQWVQHAPRLRWAFYSPCHDTLQRLRALADAGELVGNVERVYPWRQADAALRRAAEPGLRGKLVVDFTL